ncbi:MAG: ABC transporter permease [Thermoanaerobaculia bacterium]|nr:ABC transporter permease [Thermoanaerobaculia bacterium]
MSFLRRTILGRAPRTALAAIVVAAMGIGLSSAAIPIFYCFFAKPNFGSPADKAYYLYEINTTESARNLKVAYPALREWGERSTCFEEFAIEMAGLVNLRIGDTVRSSMIGMVSPGYVDVRGGSIRVGRDLLDSKSGPPESEVVVSHRLWSNMGSSLGVGSHLNIGDQPFEIVGVASESLDTAGLEAWIDVRNLPKIFPMAAALLTDWETREARGLIRLKPSCTEDMVDADLRRVSSGLESVSSATHRGVHGRLEPLYEKMLRRVRSPMLSFNVAAFLGLLLATFNVVVLILYESIASTRDRATRIALGATRTRIVRSGLLDVLLVVLLGSLIAIPVVNRLGAALASLIPNSLAAELGPSGPELGWLSLAVSALLLTVVVGLFQAVHLQRETGRPTGQRGFTSPLRVRWISGVIVFAQIALASGSVLLASNLMISYQHLSDVDPGYDSGDLIAVGVSLPADRFADPPARFAYFERARAKLAALPGVLSVSAGLDLPLEGVSCWEEIALVEPDAPTGGSKIGCQLVGPDYFQTLGVEVVQGQSWKREEFRDGSVRQVLVNEDFARRFLSGTTVVGSQLRLRDESLVEVIGVVGDIHQNPVEESITPLLYMPGFGNFLQIFVRTGGSTGAKLINDVEYTLTASEDGVAIYSSRMADTIVEEETRQIRTLALTVVLTAVLSMIVGLIGVYAVVAQAMRRRRQEFLVRMAFGGTAFHVTRRLLTPIILATGLGLCAGGFLYFTAMPLFQQLLHGISAEQPVLMGAVVVFAVLVAALASGGIAALELRRYSLRDVARFGVSDG